MGRIFVWNGKEINPVAEPIGSWNHDERVNESLTWFKAKLLAARTISKKSGQKWSGSLVYAHLTTERQRVQIRDEDVLQATEETLHKRVSELPETLADKDGREHEMWVVQHLFFNTLH